MRTILFALFVLICCSSHAQVTLSFTGGANSTTVHFSPKNSAVTAGARYGWQAGLHLDGQVKHWLWYTGLSLHKNVFFTGETSYITEFTDTYRPLFLNVPLGTGYSFKLNPALSLRLYAGLYGNLGTGGRLNEQQLLTGCDPMACPENYHPPVLANTNRAIGYGSNATVMPWDDMRKANWGAQFGAAVKAWKSMELGLVYNMGLSNIKPAGDASQQQKLRSIDLDIKVGLITFKHL